MPFSRPTLARLISRASGDIEAELQNGASRIRRSVEYTMARAVAGAAHGLHGHAEFISEQIIPDSAESEILGRWADIFGVSRRQATKALFNVTFTGTASSTIPLATQVQRADGVVFETTAASSIPAVAPFEVVVEVEATDDFEGAQGNTDGGSTLSLVSPVAGVDPTVTAEGTSGTLVGSASDIETDDSLLSRLLDRVQTPPSGGGPGDWVEEAETVEGVTRAWELPLNSGPGTVDVIFVLDIFDTDGNFVQTNLPGAPKVAEVQAALDAFAPVIAIGTAAAAVEETLSPSIQLEPNTATVQAAVDAQLNDLLLRRSAPGGELKLSEINEAISLATGETDHVLVSPVADVPIGATAVLTLGTPVYAPIP